MALIKKEDAEEMVIKPEAIGPSVDTSGWPLLLKNWDQCAFPTLFHDQRYLLMSRPQCSFELVTSRPFLPDARP